MARVAEFAWQSPPPTSVDEQLVLYDDGTARLVVRHARMMSPTIGSFTTRPSSEDCRALEAVGPARVAIDLLHPPGDPRIAELMPALDRICEAARESPEASATFYVRPMTPEPPGTTLSLLVVAAGERPVEFEINPAACAIHYSEQGGPLAWFEFPELHSGFVTRDARGLGGLRSAAVVEPGAYGAIAIPSTVPEGADAVAIQVAGWLRAALPDDEMPEPFEARTDPEALTG